MSKLKSRVGTVGFQKLRDAIFKSGFTPQRVKNVLAHMGYNYACYMPECRYTEFWQLIKSNRWFPDVPMQSIVHRFAPKY